MNRDFARDAVILLIALLFGAAFGAAHNLIDSRIAPDFYVLFKGVPPTAAVWPWAVYIGATRGAALGLLLGAGCCIASESREGRMLPIREVVRSMALPVAFAALGSALGGLAGWRFHSTILLHPVRAMQEVVPSTWIVYGMHQGVYVGAILGGMVAWRRLRNAVRTEEGRAASTWRP